MTDVRDIVVAYRLLIEASHQGRMRSVGTRIPMEQTLADVLAAC